MAVAIEFINVIIRKPAVERIYPGGLDGFARQNLPNLTEDENLLRVGFMGDDAFVFVSELEAVGLRHLELDPASDLSVIWSGSALPPWLVVGIVNGSAACWESDRPAGELALPEPGFLFRCPRATFNTLQDLVRQCRAELQELPSSGEPGEIGKFICTREDAQITIEVTGDRLGDSPVGLWGRRDLSRRSQFRADVTLIHDLVALLVQGGAEG